MSQQNVRIMKDVRFKNFNYEMFWKLKNEFLFLHQGYPVWLKLMS